MKKILLKIFTVVLALCCIGLIACNKAPETKATLVDFADSTVEVSYGMTYQIAEYVYDTDGNRYSLSAKVTDKDNETVTAEKSFQVIKAEYKVVYSVNFNGENVSKTVTVKGVSTPLIELADNREVTLTIGLLPSTLPDISAYDAIDGTNVTIKKEVYQMTSFENKLMTDYDGVSNTYMPKNIGTYYWKITVTNAAGISNVRLLYFYVVPDDGRVDFLAEEENLKYLSTSNSIKFEFVKNEDIPTDGIKNSVNYSGDAFVFKNMIHNRYTYLSLGYTAAEYIEMARQGRFNAVKFSFMVDNANENATGNPTVILRNNDQITNNSRSILSSAGYKNVKPIQYVPVNKWVTHVVPVDEFVQFMGDTKKGLIFRSSSGAGLDPYDFYLGDIEFITWGENDVVDNGPYDLLAVEDNLASLNFGSYEKSLVAAEDLPTEGINNTVGYAGDAFLANDVGHDKYLYANLNYSASDITKLANKGEFNAVKFSYLMISEKGVYNNDRIENGEHIAYTLMSAAGHYGDGSKGTGLTRNRWCTYVVPIADFVKAMNGNQLTLIRTAIWDAPKVCDFYLGDLEFITWGENDYIDVGSWNMTPAADEAEKFSDNFSTRDCPVSFVENANLPQNVDYGFGYEGDAMKIEQLDHQGLVIYNGLKYTAEEYIKIANKNEFNAVKISYMFTDAQQTISIRLSTPSVISQYCSDNGKPFTPDMWSEIYVPVDEFVKYIDGYSINLVQVVFWSSTAPKTCTFWFGGFELVDVDLDSIVAYNGEIGFTAEEGNEDRLLASGQSAQTPSATRLPATFVANEDIPTEGIDQGFGFTGDAMKWTGVPSSEYLWIDANYSGEDYLKLAARDGFTSVKFSMMINAPEGTVIRNRGTSDHLMNLMTKAGFYYDSTWASANSQIMPINVWSTYVFSIEDFAECIHNGRLLITRTNGDAGCDIYISSIEMSTEDPADNLTYKGAWDWTPSADEVANISDSFTSKNCPVSFVENANLPQDADYGYGFEGDALKVEDVSRQGEIYINGLNYTAEEYTKLAERNGYNAVKIRFMITDNSQAICTRTSTSNVISKYFEDTYKKDDKAVSFKSNLMYEIYVPVEDFVVPFNENRVTIIQVITWNNNVDDTCTIYLGGFEFVEVDFDEIITYNGEKGVTVTADNASKYSATASKTTKAFVENANLPTEGIDNFVGYNGDAIMFDIGTTTSHHFYVSLNYTAAEYEKFIEREEFNAVKFSYLVHTTADTFRNRSFEGYEIYSILSAAGYHGTGDNAEYDSNNGAATKLPLNMWQTVYIKAEDFLKAIDPTTGKLCLAARITANTETDFYMGNIEMVTVTDWDSIIPYKGEYGFTPSESIIAKVTDTRDIPCPLSFVENKDLPTNVDYGFGYEGNVIKVEDFNSDTVLKYKLNYTADEYAKIIKQKGYTFVKVGFMFQTSDGQSISVRLNKANMISKYYNEAGVKSYKQNVWTELYIPTDTFIYAIDGEYLSIIQTAYWTMDLPRTGTFYFGGMEFVTTPAAEIENYVAFNGELGFTASEDLDLTKFYNSGTRHSDITYVSSTDLAKLEGIDNTVGYTGGAIKYGDLVHDKYVYFTTNYTYAEYLKLIEQEGYNAIEFYYMVTLGTAASSGNNSNGTTNYTLLTAAGHFSTTNGGNGTGLSTGKWVKVVVKVEDMVKSLLEFGDSEDSVKLCLVRTAHSTSGRTATYYFGNMTFLKNYTGEYSFTPAQ